MFKYAVGRIRAIEARMLDENKLLSMSEAEDFQSAYHILNESDYADFLSFDFETMLALARQELKKLSEFLAPKNELIRAFWAKYDFENIKILLKAKKLNLDPPPLYKCGNIKPEKLKEHIFKGADAIERFYKELIAQALQIRNTLKMFDFLDNAYQKYYKSATPALSKNAKYFAGGIEPILLFLQNKEKEIKNIGFILECKKNDISPQQIKERIEKSV